MERIPEQLRQRLVQVGYDRIERLPNNAESSRWNDVRVDCGLSRPELKEVINALFPAPTPSETQNWSFSPFEWLTKLEPKRSDEELSKLYNVRFRLVDSKKSKGYRLSVYKCAPSCLAYYSSEDKEKSIFYDVNSPTPTDLVVSLVFKAERDALLFQNSLLDLTEKFQHFRDKFVLETHEPSVIHVESCTNLTRVLTSDYDKNENNETHIMSLNDIMSNESTITVYTNTETLLKTLEAEEIVASFDKKWYKCHFIPNDCKLYRNDPNRNHDDNFIWGSRNFHQLFDGLHTVNSGVGVVLRFVRSNPNGEEVLVAPNRYESRYCVFISVEFKNAKVAASFASYFKDGTKRLTDTKYETFIYVKDVNVVQDCLRKKFMFEKEEQEDPWLEEMEYD